MFHADITFTLALIALVSGAFLVLSAKAHPDIPTLPCQVIGYAVAVIAILVLLFSGYLVARKSVMGYQMRGQMMRPATMAPMHMQRGMMRMQGIATTPMHPMPSAAQPDEAKDMPMQPQHMPGMQEGMQHQDMMPTSS